MEWRLGLLGLGGMALLIYGALTLTPLGILIPLMRWEDVTFEVVCSEWKPELCATVFLERPPSLSSIDTYYILLGNHTDLEDATKTHGWYEMSDLSVDGVRWNEADEFVVLTRNLFFPEAPYVGSDEPGFTLLFERSTEAQ